MTAEKAKQYLVSALDRLEYGSLTVCFPNGKVHDFCGQNPGAHGHIHIHHLSVISNLLRKGDIGFAEDYYSGRWDSDDLTSLFRCIANNQMALKNLVYGKGVGVWLAKLRQFLRLNTQAGSKKNIHDHYDIGNAFYRLWLDPTMTYSSALFHETEDLTQAQYNKYDRLLDKIGDRSQSILEIGCGWGGFAERSLHRHDHRLQAITISKAQHAFSHERLAHADNVDIRFQDYRAVEGKFDAVVSIEMFEAVGERYWKTYFDKIKSVLHEKGTALIQTITIDDDYFALYRGSIDPIRSYIFPGGMLSSPPVFFDYAERSGLAIKDCFSFGQDYAKTLRMWQESFHAQKAQIRALGFDEKFIRLWRFYLSGCEAWFACGRTDVIQVELVHAKP